MGGAVPTSLLEVLAELFRDCILRRGCDPAQEMVR